MFMYPFPYFLFRLSYLEWIFISWNRAVLDQKKEPNLMAKVAT